MPTIKPLPEELRDEIARLQSAAAALLAVDPTAAPTAIVAAIDDWVRHDKSAGRVPGSAVMLEVGLLLAEQYVRELGWHWAMVEWSSDPIACVLNDDNSVAINGIGWVNDVFTRRASTNFLLNFNMMKSGAAPRGNTNEACIVH